MGAIILNALCFFEAALLFKCKIIIASLYFTKAIWQMRNVF